MEASWEHHLFLAGVKPRYMGKTGANWEFPQMVVKSKGNPSPKSPKKNSGLGIIVILPRCFWWMNLCLKNPWMVKAWTCVSESVRMYCILVFVLHVIVPFGFQRGRTIHTTSCFFLALETDPCFDWYLVDHFKRIPMLHGSCLGIVFGAFVVVIVIPRFHERKSSSSQPYYLRYNKQMAMVLISGYNSRPPKKKMLSIVLCRLKIQYFPQIWHENSCYPPRRVDVFLDWNTFNTRLHWEVLAQCTNNKKMYQWLDESRLAQAHCEKGSHCRFVSFREIEQI